VSGAAKRRLGSPVLWGLVQAFVAAGFYFSLGLVAERAQGWTWLVYLTAAVFFVLTALSYMEAASLHQERGGVTIIARYAFNELVSFIAGWAIMLDYVILIALTAFTITDYLAVLWSPLGQGGLELALAAAAIVLAAVINVRGIDPARFLRFFVFALADLGVQVFLLVIGLIVLFDPQVISHPGHFGSTPGLRDMFFAFPLAIVAFTALDASSGFAGQVAVGRKGLKKLLTARFASLTVAYVGLALIAASTIGPGTGPAQRTDAPVLGVIAQVHQDGLREGLRLMVGLSATFVLFTACVGSMLGLSRLGYALAVNRQIPSRIGRLHPRFKTPTVIIGIGTLLALALVIPEDTEFLGAIYAFGATVAFVIVHLSVLVLRRREPDRDRPFRIPLAIRGLPVSAMLGLLMAAGALVSVLALHSAARWIGPLWMLAGLALYIVYRTGSEKSLTRRLTVPEETLTRADGQRAEYGSILVPVFGNQFDEDIMQTAGRLAAEESTDDEDEGAQIEALWVMVVPMSLPLDGRVPDADVKHARQQLKHAKAVGEEYAGVVVNPFIVRARNVGEAIVREARRRGVEAIVMPAEEPTRIRGGMVLGGLEGMRSTFVGETTRYVIGKASCRVILTAPPSAGPRKLRDRPGAPPPSGDPVRRAANRLRRRPAGPDHAKPPAPR
jgi:APA family basic amino acid/polyamine antiporter